MKHSAPYLMIAFLIVLMVIVLFHPASKTESKLQPYNAQIETTFNDSLRSFQIKSNALDISISSLKSKNEQLTEKYLLQQKLFIQKIHEIKVLPADSQLLVFKETTGCTKNINLILSAAGDTMAKIPLKSLRNADLKFVELEATSTCSFCSLN